MEAATLKALEASIAKWEKNTTAETRDDYRTHWSDCPLCLLFNGDNIHVHTDRCKGCPVYEKTGQKWCDGTPFRAASMAKDVWIAGKQSDAVKARKAAETEVAFLKSLLPVSP